MPSSAAATLSFRGFTAQRFAVDVVGYKQTDVVDEVQRICNSLQLSPLLMRGAAMLDFYTLEQIFPSPNLKWWKLDFRQKIIKIDNAEESILKSKHVFLFYSSRLIENTQRNQFYCSYANLAKC